MAQRIDYNKVSPNSLQGFIASGKYLETCGIEEKIKRLVELRVSQINGCAYCVDMHCEQLRALDVDQQRIDCVCVWREVPFFNDRERAALAWAESVTLVSATRVPDEVYNKVRDQFEEKELVDLTVLIATMNALNRIAVSFRKTPIRRS
jgi:AhpD family alkylhydroperoxidase